MGGQRAETEIITAALARAYWRALLGNATALIEDAALLLEQSPARARSLLILAQEETGKAHWLYELVGQSGPPALPTVDLPPYFTDMERRHGPKLEASLEQAADLAAFWGDYSDLASPPPLDASSEEWGAHIDSIVAGHRRAAREINGCKQAGFYVDREGETVRGPQDVSVPTVVSSRHSYARRVATVFNPDETQRSRRRFIVCRSPVVPATKIVPGPVGALGPGRAAAGHRGLGMVMREDDDPHFLPRRPRRSSSSRRCRTLAVLVGGDHDTDRSSSLMDPVGDLLDGYRLFASVLPGRCPAGLYLVRQNR